MASGNDDNLTLARAWLAKARGDLAMAHAGLHEHGAPGWGIAFHCQQAVEKAFKGALAARGAAWRKNHDLVELVDRLAVAEIACPLDAATIQALIPFAVEERYPILDAPELSRADAAQLVPMARLAVDWLEGQLSS